MPIANSSRAPLPASTPPSPVPSAPATLRAQVRVFDTAGQPQGPARRLRPGANLPVHSADLVALADGTFVALYGDPQDGSVRWNRHGSNGAPSMTELTVGSSGVGIDMSAELFHP